MVSQPRVLIADDNRTNQVIISRLLESEGFDPVAVSSADAVLDEVQRGLPFDAVVLDVYMPGMSGADALSLIRYEERRRARAGRVPAIIVTGDGSPAVREECMRAGADAFLTHPISASALADILNRLITSRTQTSPPDDPSPLATDKLESLLMSVGADDLMSAWDADSSTALGYMKSALACEETEVFREQFWNLCSASLSFGGTNIRDVYEAAGDFQAELFSRTGPIIFECLLYEVSILTNALEQIIASGAVTSSQRSSLAQ
jgi:two-component system sensor histidine kinase RpfC